MNKLIENKVIKASAGSGKTFQLALRYIKLLSAGIAPEHIVALTFTKKAAGEMFDKIISILINWYRNEKDRAAQTQSIGIKNLETTQISNWLEKLIGTQHKAVISTLDSFFVSILRNFPFEFEMSGSFEIFDDYQKMVRREYILKTLLGKIDGESKKELFQEYKKATFGYEETSSHKTIGEFVEDYYDNFLKLKNKTAWGNINKLWEGKTCEIIEDSKSVISLSLEELVKPFASMVALGKIDDDQFEKIKSFIGETCNFNESSEINDKYFALKIVKIIDELKTGFARLTIGKKKNKNIDLNTEACRSLYFSSCKFLSIIYIRQMLKTRGIYEVLEKYDKLYMGIVRKNGKLTFADIPYLLSGKQLTEYETFENNRLYIDYRLDSRYDHWMLDEFQDTSLEQWNIIENLVGEVMQSHQTGDRSFFYVGDVKQSIYAWRGGDYYLFDKILRGFTQKYGQESIVKCELSKSYRSAKTIIEAVNRLFSNLRSLHLADKAEAEKEIWDSAVDLWDGNWTTHETVKNSEGYVTIFETDGESEDEYELVASIIKSSEVEKRDFTIGILTRSNKEAKKVFFYLKKLGIHVSLEGEAIIMDEPATALMLSLLKITEHPADTYAWEHLKMSRLYEHLIKCHNSEEDLIRNSSSAWIKMALPHL